MLKKIKKSFIASAVLATGLAFGGAARAADTQAADMSVKIPRIQRLSGVDTLVTTIVSKSKIAGTLEKDASGTLVMDANGNFKFNFSGNIYFYFVRLKRNLLI